MTNGREKLPPCALAAECVVKGRVDPVLGAALVATNRIVNLADRHGTPRE
jgi:hypothetical protein